MAALAAALSSILVKFADGEGARMLNGGGGMLTAEQLDEVKKAMAETLAAVVQEVEENEDFRVQLLETVSVFLSGNSDSEIWEMLVGGAVMLVVMAVLGVLLYLLKVLRRGGVNGGDQRSSTTADASGNGEDGLGGQPVVCTAVRGFLTRLSVYFRGVGRAVVFTREVEGRDEAVGGEGLALRVTASAPVPSDKESSPGEGGQKSPGLGMQDVYATTSEAESRGRSRSQEEGYPPRYSFSDNRPENAEAAIQDATVPTNLETLAKQPLTRRPVTAPEVGLVEEPVLQDVGSDRGADNRSLEGPTLSDVEEGGFSSRDPARMAAAEAGAEASGLGQGGAEGGGEEDLQDLLGNPSKPVASTAESGLAETSAELQVNPQKSPLTETPHRDVPRPKGHDLRKAVSLERLEAEEAMEDRPDGRGFKRDGKKTRPKKSRGS